MLVTHFHKSGKHHHWNGLGSYCREVLIRRPLGQHCSNDLTLHAAIFAKAGLCLPFPLSVEWVAAEADLVEPWPHMKELAVSPRGLAGSGVT
ncbi:hypothetical protein QFZ43_000171 [Streptomyces afghaniensis]|nr:hypothetical protein [Streptomyces afghaniensis]